jgi:very-short-patch-repair endonuclease
LAGAGAESAGVNHAAILLEIHMKELGIDFTPEFRFALPRQWRFDYLIGDIDERTAVEIEGGIFSQGRHVRGAGYEKDLEKYREAAARGYKVYRFSTGEVLKGVAREFLAKHFRGRVDHKL